MSFVSNDLQDCMPERAASLFDSEGAEFAEV